MASTVAELLSETATRDPDGVALVHAANRVGWATLDSRVSAFAAGAAARGLRRGDRVGIVTASRTEFVVAHLGALRAGLVSVPLNPALTAHELAQRTHDTRPSLVVCDAASELATREALTLNHIGTGVVVPVGSAEWGDLVRGDRLAAPVDVTPESPAALMFTGGVHARAQAATISHRAMLAAIEQFGGLEPAPLVAGDVLLLALPLVHAQTLNSLLGLAVAVGATVVIDRWHDPDESLDVVGREGVTVVAADPVLLAQWAASPRVADALDGVRLMALGQASLAVPVAQQLLTLTGHHVWSGYGMAEAAGLLTCTAGHEGKAGSLGTALPGVELRIVDNDGDDVDDDDDPGEVLVRAASLFSGYWPDGRGAPDEWLATDDVAYVDESGGLHLVDRRHDMIVVSGFPVFPREVEAAVASMPGVAECAVVGVEHPLTGQAVVALVVAEPDASVAPEAVVAHCATVLARHKCPTIVQLVDELPHTESGALQRHRLLEG